jgi:hypothetical protein
MFIEYLIQKNIEWIIQSCYDESTSKPLADWQDVFERL